MSDLFTFLWDWVSNVWYKANDEPSFWALMGVVITAAISTTLSLILNSRSHTQQLERDDRADNRAKGREVDNHALEIANQNRLYEQSKEDRRVAFHRETIVDLAHAASKLDLVLSRTMIELPFYPTGQNGKRQVSPAVIDRFDAIEPFITFSGLVNDAELNLIASQVQDETRDLIQAMANNIEIDECEAKLWQVKSSLESLTARSRILLHEDL